jgi:GNAT superfamily N-acetyltransferase
MTTPRIVEEPIGILPEYSKIPISFEVHSVLEVGLADRGLTGVTLSEQPVKKPWVKDYDSHKGGAPMRWARRWDISNWGVICAFLDDSRVGGCVIAHDTLGVEKLEGRKDIAVLWDLRVSPEYRRRGIGSALIESAVAWARRRQCCVLKVETQNINVPACHLYASKGFTLGMVNRFAYQELPDDVELVWYKGLWDRRTSGSSVHRYGGMALASGDGKRPAASARRSATPLGGGVGITHRRTLAEGCQANHDRRWRNDESARERARRGDLGRNHSTGMCSS